MKLVRKYLIRWDIQAQYVYIKSESISEALEYLRRSYPEAKAFEFYHECPNRMPYDIEV